MQNLYIQYCLNNSTTFYILVMWIYRKKDILKGIFIPFLIFQLLREWVSLDLKSWISYITNGFFHLVSQLFRNTFLISWTHAQTAQDFILYYAYTYFISMLKSNDQVYIYNNIHTHQGISSWMSKIKNPLSEEYNMVFK